MNHKELIETEFKKQAKNFEKPGYSLTNKDYLEWVVQSLPLSDNQKVLDVACGTGILSRSVSKSVNEVIAIDTSSEMLEVAKKEIEKTKINNIVLEEGVAEDLPYEDNSFDMVVSRLAIHHFKDPNLCIKEMARVCKQSNLVAVIDLLSPENPELKELYNSFEKLRDPSHVITLNKEEISDIMTQNNLNIIFSDSIQVELDLENWFKLTRTPEAIKKQIKKGLKKDFDGVEETGLYPFFKNGNIKIKQIWGIVIGEKI